MDNECWLLILASLTLIAGFAAAIYGWKSYRLQREAYDTRLRLEVQTSDAGDVKMRLFVRSQHDRIHLRKVQYRMFGSDDWHNVESLDSDRDRRTAGPGKPVPFVFLKTHEAFRKVVSIRAEEDSGREHIQEVPEKYVDA